MKKNNIQLLIFSIIAICGLACFVWLFVGRGFTQYTDNSGNTYILPNPIK